MGDNFQSFYEQPFTPTDKMSRSEVDDELTRWRNLWTWLEADVQWWLTHVGVPFRIIRRDYKAFTGRLGQPHFELKMIDVEVVEREYNYATGIATYESKTITIGLGSIIDYELIEGKEEIKETVLGDEVAEDKGEPIDDFV